MCGYRRRGEDWPFRSDRSLVIQRREYCRPLRALPSPLPTSQHELDLLLAQAASQGDRYNVISVRLPPFPRPSFSISVF
jgi:hypothetical protein